MKDWGLRSRYETNWNETRHFLDKVLFFTFLINGFVDSIFVNWTMQWWHLEQRGEDKMDDAWHCYGNRLRPTWFSASSTSKHYLVYHWRHVSSRSTCEESADWWWTVHDVTATVATQSLQLLSNGSNHYLTATKSTKNPLCYSQWNW